MDKTYCSICAHEVDRESAPILTMSRYGNPRYLCSMCSSLFDRALLTRDYDGVEEAVNEIGQTMERGNVEDELVIEEVGEILSRAKERAELIRSGEYDFSLDDSDINEDSEELEIPEDADECNALKEPDPAEETEEERLKREKNERINKIIDRVMQCLYLGVFAGFLIYIIIKLIF